MEDIKTYIETLVVPTETPTMRAQKEIAEFLDSRQIRTKDLLTGLLCQRTRMPAVEVMQRAKVMRIATGGSRRRNESY